MAIQKTRRIAMILYTQGLAYDNRVRKEILTIKRLYKDIDLADISSIIGDRLHPNDEGYKVMFNNVMKELQMPIFIKRGE